MYLDAEKIFALVEVSREDIFVVWLKELVTLLVEMESKATKRKLIVSYL